MNFLNSVKIKTKHTKKKNKFTVLFKLGNWLDCLVVFLSYFIGADRLKFKQKTFKNHKMMQYGIILKTFAVTQNKSLYVCSVFSIKLSTQFCTNEKLTIKRFKIVYILKKFFF